MIPVAARSTRAVALRPAARFFSLEHRANRGRLGLGTVRTEFHWRDEERDPVMKACSDPRRKPNTARIVAATKEGNFEQAMEAFRAGPGEPSPINFNAILRSADKLGKEAELEELFNEMVTKGHPMSASSYTPVMNL